MLSPFLFTYLTLPNKTSFHFIENKIVLLSHWTNISQASDKVAWFLYLLQLPSTWSMIKKRGRRKYFLFVLIHRVVPLNAVIIDD